MIIKSKFNKYWGSYPWPDSNLLDDKKISKKDSEYSRLIKDSKEISEKWLFAQKDNLIFDEVKRTELFELIKDKIPYWEYYMQEKIEMYISWLGWHEGITSK